MKAILFVAMMMYASHGNGRPHDDLVASLGNGNMVTLTQDRCTNPAVIKTIQSKPGVKPSAIKAMRAGATLWEGKLLQMCWREMESQGVAIVFIVDETGDFGVLPRTMFVKTLKV